jgi:tRNA threonylcarbamoyladenosine biosynthesis protein TsaE
VLGRATLWANTAEQMELLGEAIGAVLEAGDRVMLHGQLGAGKTTLTRGIGRALGAQGTVQSPTFVLARTHRTTRGPRLVHADAYRLGSAAELYDLDIDFDNQIAVVEWPRDFIDAESDKVLSVTINPDYDSEQRVIEVCWQNSKWDFLEKLSLR